MTRKHRAIPPPLPGRDGRADAPPRSTTGRRFAAFGLFVILVVILLAALSVPNVAETDAKEESPTQKLTIAGRHFDLELALTPQQRYQGLSDRESIPADGGMLFVFPSPDVHAFVMRRCLVPIDLVFVDKDGRITALHEMTVEPYDTPENRLKRYPSVKPVVAAIELRAGSIAKLGLETGGQIDLPYNALKRRAR